MCNNEESKSMGKEIHVLTYMFAKCVTYLSAEGQFRDLQRESGGLHVKPIFTGKKQKV